MQIGCVFIFAMFLMKTGVSSSPNVVVDLLQSLTSDQQTNQVVDEIVAKIHKIVDDTIAQAEGNLKVTQEKIAGFYQTAGSLRGGGLDKAQTDETAELVKFNGLTETEVKAAIVQVRATVENGVARVEVIAKSKNIPQSIIDAVKKRVTDVIDRAVERIEQILQDYYKNSVEEVKKSHERQKTLRDLEVNCGSTLECSSSFDLLWKTEVTRCAGRVRQIFECTVADIQWEIQLAVTQVKIEINPIVIALKAILDPVLRIL